MKDRERPVVKLFRAAVIQLLPKPYFDFFNLRNDRSVRSALFLSDWFVVSVGSGPAWRETG